MTTILRREFPTHTRSDDQARTVSGIAVPYGQEIELTPGLFETIAPGAYTPRDDAHTAMKLMWRHREIIGPILSANSEPDGVRIKGRISETSLGNDAYALVRDGAVDRFSVGFIPLESTEMRDEDGNIHITYTAIEILEVSLVPWPAYEGARLENVRHTHTLEGTPAMPETTETPAIETRAVDELRAEVRALAQTLDLMRSTPTPSPAADNRSAAAFLRDLATGDEETARIYNAAVALAHDERAYSGTKSDADPTMDTPTFMKDLTRLFNQADNLKPLFATGPLPTEGKSLEYAEMETSTIKVVEHEEGSDVVMGKLSLTDKIASIKAYAGGTQLTRVAIERSRLPILQRHLEAMTLAAGEMSAQAFAAAFAEAVKTQDDRKISLTKAANQLKWGDLTALVIDAAAAFKEQHLTLDGLVVNPETFKALAALTGTDGRGLMTVTGTQANATGHIDLTGLSADLAGLTVVPNFRHKTNELGENIVGAFFYREAMRSYETSLVQLQSDNVLNLTKAFATYRYAAYAPEIPTGLVPLKIGA